MFRRDRLTAGHTFGNSFFKVYFVIRKVFDLKFEPKPVLMMCRSRTKLGVV